MEQGAGPRDAEEEAMPRSGSQLRIQQWVENDWRYVGLVFHPWASMAPSSTGVKGENVPRAGKASLFKRVCVRVPVSIPSDTVWRAVEHTSLQLRTELKLEDMDLESFIQRE